MFLTLFPSLFLCGKRERKKKRERKRGGGEKIWMKRKRKWGWKERENRGEKKEKIGIKWWTVKWVKGWKDDRWTSEELTLWRLLLQHLSYFIILFTCLCPHLDVKFHKTETWNLSVFIFSGSGIVLSWWQGQQQVKNTCLLRRTDFSSILLFLSLPIFFQE